MKRYNLREYKSILKELHNSFRARSAKLDEWEGAINSKNKDLAKKTARELAYIEEECSSLEDMLVARVNYALSKPDLKKWVYKKLKKDVFTMRDNIKRIVEREAELTLQAAKAFPDEPGAIPSTYLDEINPAKAEQFEIKRYTEHIKKSVDPDSKKSYV